ncbi:MAG: MarR family transcriptional regulator [Melioribacteraceae bacterium]|nr:MarR family transcriptional regulator [Melioribacteraceae bacterium]
MENKSLKSFVVLMKASKAVQERITTDIASYDMRTSEFVILETLHHKGKQTVRQIADAVLIKTGSITYVIDKLEVKGWVTRSDCKEDRRVVYIELTEEGKRLMDTIFPQHQLVIEELFSGLSSEEQEVFIELLKRVGKKEIVKKER